MCQTVLAHSAKYTYTDNNLVFSCKQVSLEENSSYREAWTLFYKEDMKKALDIVEKYEASDCKCKDWWAVLRGAIYARQGRFKDSLDIVNNIRSRIIVMHQSLKDKDLLYTEEERQDIEFVFARMIGASGEANYHLNNWNDAIKDLTLYSEGIKSADIYDVIANCYYKTKQLDKALAYFKLSYQLHTDVELKDYAAYNLAALSSLKGNVEDAISWLKIPFQHHKEKWLKEIDTDEDFDPIRGKKEFKYFLKENR